MNESFHMSAPAGCLWSQTPYSTIRFLWLQASTRPACVAPCIHILLHYHAQARSIVYLVHSLEYGSVSAMWSKITNDIENFESPKTADTLIYFTLVEQV